jgi:hypothetical protein
LDLRGRMTFRIESGLGDNNLRRQKNNDLDIKSVDSYTDDPWSCPPDGIILVLDPTILFLVQTMPDSDHRGTIVCALPLLHIIAAASDGAWLHVAVRHNDVPHLIKNHNMALLCENPGTSLIIRQYLDRSRALLREQTWEMIQKVFAVDNVSLPTQSSDSATQV